MTVTAALAVRVYVCDGGGMPRQAKREVFFQKWLYKKADKKQNVTKTQRKRKMFVGLEQVQKKKKQEKLGGLCSGDASRGRWWGEARAC